MRRLHRHELNLLETITDGSAIALGGISAGICHAPHAPKIRFKHATFVTFRESGDLRVALFANSPTCRSTFLRSENATLF